ncbi:Crp/Fnr family transcriptional regulator [Psychroflexus gondwanensis]|jgi:CRP/FNR family transcriptional regulator|uniref:Transcriptional regulator, Crp/Fnr family protein n=1 Tax=Psychroflexus gondwanensis ACAM 44 TaxID=1189619 RepID=N1WZZ6_9FLAO|nr:Crp/Fnr family transcriptional regulator [Psychroflexus gondwanensis]EMY81443.1 transcriptional regulator, Crp/Fnr family protein [Psychroflexus gondwanensis ACAM 44]TXE21081.1 Crp/Fnr family transcriptional regulator [Psychroflexus gondwanensis]
MIDQIKSNYGHIFEEELIQEINEVGVIKSIEAGGELIRPGQYMKAMPLLLDGVIKVMREDDDGFELMLYFLEKGETCAMTLSCCTGSAISEIKAVAETDSDLLMIPIEKMEEWLGKYKSWRNFIFNSYHERLMEVLETIDNIAFKRMDERLIDYLRNKSKHYVDSEIKITHQDIAYDLHTSRVVISRLLKQLEKINKIKLNRNSIKILNIG